MKKKLERNVTNEELYRFINVDNNYEIDQQELRQAIDAFDMGFNKKQLRIIQSYLSQNDGSNDISEEKFLTQMKKLDLIYAKSQEIIKRITDLNQRDNAVARANERKGRSSFLPGGFSSNFNPGIAMPVVAFTNPLDKIRLEKQAKMDLRVNLEAGHNDSDVSKYDALAEKFGDVTECHDFEMDFDFNDFFGELEF